MKKLFLIGVLSFCAQFPILSATVTTSQTEVSKKEYCICGSKERLIKMLALALRANASEHNQALIELTNDKKLPDDKKLEEFSKLIKQYENTKTEIKDKLVTLVNETEAKDLIQQAEESMKTLKFVR